MRVREIHAGDVSAWLHVKTRGPSTPDPGCEKTRRFYLAAGFDPLFESLTLWDPEDAARILVESVPLSSGSLACYSYPHAFPKADRPA